MSASSVASSLLVSVLAAPGIRPTRAAALLGVVSCSTPVLVGAAPVCAATSLRVPTGATPTSLGGVARVPAASTSAVVVASSPLQSCCQPREPILQGPRS